MDGEGGLNLQNWGSYPPMMKSHNQIPLQLMPTMDRKPFLGGRESSFMASMTAGFHRDCGTPASHYQMDYMRDWIAREPNRFSSNGFSGNHGYSVPTDSSSTIQHQPVQLIRQPDSSSEERMVRTDGFTAESSNGPAKKRSAGKPEKAPKAKKPKKAPNGAKEGVGVSAHRAKAPKKPAEVVINGIDMDISSIPIPVCSCTGAPQQCYRWGSGGWQSACCTTGMSMYPLPMSTKRRGARIAGRKMSLGAFKKVLEKLAGEGYNFSSNPIDLRTHWAKHGTNKFVTIRNMLNLLPCMVHRIQLLQLCKLQHQYPIKPCSERLFHARQAMNNYLVV
ncbi:hypothetical protein Droror1_Dr00006196 [Drosera rotundifolia]